MMNQMMGSEGMNMMEQMEDQMMGSENHERMEEMMDRMMSGQLTVEEQEEMCG